MEVVKISPRGYCHGVVKAINIVKDALNNPKLEKPIYILGMIVHNKLINDALIKQGAIIIRDKSKSRLELLDEIDIGTVIFTAHGVSDKVIQKAMSKNLHIINATCKDVIKSQNVIKEYIAMNYDVIYIGKNNHPESESVLQKGVHLITALEDIHALKINNNHIAITNQTTMSVTDIKEYVLTIKQKYPNSIFINEICNATRIRQEAILKNKDNIDACIVVGDKFSNNSNKLVEIASNAGMYSVLVEKIDDIDVNLIKNYKKIGVTSGASTPTTITNEVIDFLIQLDVDNPGTFHKNSKINYDNLF